MLNVEFVDEAANSLVKRRCTAKVEKEEGTFCSPLCVVKARNKRFILDLREVNRFLFHKKIKLEGIKAPAQIYEKDFLIHWT